MTNLINTFKRFISAVVPVLFVAAGIALVVMGFKDLRYQKEYVPATAVVSSVQHVEELRNAHTDIYVKYTVDGKQYESLLQGYQGKWNVGDEIQVRYDPADPAVVVSVGPSSTTMMFIAGAIAIVLGLAGAIRLFINR